jgi:hypothetical protein
MARRGRDGRPLRDVDVASEYLEVERRRYHQRIRDERQSRKPSPTVKEALEEAVPRFRDKGWKVTTEGEDKR